MIKGAVNCSCKQSFGFETVEEAVRCPVCRAEYLAADHAATEIIGEVAEHGTDI